MRSSDDVKSPTTAAGIRLQIRDMIAVYDTSCIHTLIDCPRHDRGLPRRIDSRLRIRDNNVHDVPAYPQEDTGKRPLQTGII